ALAVGLAAAATALGALGLAVVAVATLAALALARFLTARLGGITGDVFGAAIETAELAGLLTVSAWTHLRP
ncbi:MAG: adenosylcobinamide-GDP ribazoletransferase, partial [Candidatus Rokubacteria bacterium]|nr:adenosylcobinamide-GDP ribazoletransferase [Candidatus Rokubacteria bacterium]